MEFTISHFRFTIFLFSFSVLSLCDPAMAQSINHQNVEINFNFSFSEKKLAILYQIDPPDNKSIFEYDFGAHSIEDFSKIVLRPRGTYPFQFDGRRLSFEHNGNPYQKYEFKIYYAFDRLAEQGVFKTTEDVSQFTLNSDVISQFVPMAISYNARYSVSVCADESFQSSLKNYVTFTDRKTGQSCLFATNVAIDALTKLTIAFGRQDLIASNPVKAIANTEGASGTLDKDQKSRTTVHTRPSEDAMEHAARKSHIRLIKENFCARILPENITEKCGTDSNIFFPGFFIPYDSKIFLFSKPSESQIFCLNNAFEKCSYQPFASDILSAFYFVRDALENADDLNSFLVIKSAVESNINSGSRNWVRIYYIGVFYNIFYHFGKQILFNVFNEFLAQYPKTDIEDILANRKLTARLDFNRIPPSMTFSPLTYSISSVNTVSNKYNIAISDSSQVIRPGTLMKWILYLSDRTVDTLYTTKDQNPFQEFTFQTDPDILFVYPKWEEHIIWPTTERRPDFHALNELNRGNSTFNRYRAYRTMAGTGNPNLLATAISLALDENAGFIRNFAFERLGEVPDYQVLKVRDGLFKSISTTDGFWRPTVYQNAERLGLSVRRPALGNQKGIDLYADLRVLKQFEGERAMDMALESFVEGNTDEGLLWFLAENGSLEVVRLLLTFEAGTDVKNAIQRICLVYQSQLFSGKIKIQEATQAVLNTDKELQSAGFTKEEITYIIKNTLLNLRIFNASFTTLYN